MDRMPRLHSVRAPFLFGAICLIALLALGSGQWFAEPVSAQRGTVPTRTPTAPPPTEAPATSPAATQVPATPTPAATLAPPPAALDEPTPVAPAGVLPSVGSMVEASISLP